MEKKPFLTILFLPEGTGKVRRITFSEKGYKRFRYIGLSLLFLFCFGFVYGIRSFFSLPERLRMERTLSLQKVELEKYRRKLLLMEETLKRIQDLEREVRIALGEKPSPPLPGIGGFPREGAEPRWEGVDPITRELLEDLKARSEQTQQMLNQQEYQMLGLHHSLLLKENKLLYTPSIQPTEGWITSEFGARDHPFTGISSVHEGMDIATQFGNPVVASASGIVLFAGEKGGYGKLVIVDHGFGITTYYGHLSEILVRPGVRVSRGQMIGRVGNTGFSTGPHLHYEVRILGVPVNPQNYLLANKKF